MIITYTAFDGKIFNDQKECEDYEDKLKLLGLAYSEFSKFLDKIPEDYNDNLWICKEKLEIYNPCGQELPTIGETVKILTKDDLAHIRVIKSLLEKFKLDDNGNKQNCYR